MPMGEKPQDKQPQPLAPSTAKSEAVSADRAGNRPSASVKAQRLGTTDAFVLSHVFPEPASVFTRNPATLDAAWSDCLFVLDTNVLLLPYRAGTESLKKIGEIYKSLIKSGRLFIPARVAQEFAANRSERLKEVHQQLYQHQSGVQIPGALSLQFLADLPQYANVGKANQELHKCAKAYRDAISNLRSIVEGWTWNDPVSALYSNLFEKSVVVDGSPPQEVIAADLEYRWAHKIPPGYKDASKDDTGVGDLLIWHSILALGRSHSKHLIFISGEEKPDWCVVSNKSGLYPRFELVDEYGRSSGSKSFFLLQFSDFLNRQGASATVVQEIRKEEATASAEHRKLRLVGKRLRQGHEVLERERIAAAEQRYQDAIKRVDPKYHKWWQRAYRYMMMPSTKLEALAEERACHLHESRLPDTTRRASLSTMRRAPCPEWRRGRLL
jgi:hypothetical protein